MIYSFLDFELDEDLFELRMRGQVVGTQARVFALIQYLLANRDRVISKDELVQTVWKGTAVSDTAVSQVVMLARRALGDDCERPRILKTLRGRGFRFIADVRAGAAPESLVHATIDPSPLTEALARVDDAAALAFEVESAPAVDLVGRSAELAELGRLLDQAERARGRLVILSGEPGIGKTALACEFARRSRRCGAEVIWGRAWADAGAPPFWPWIQVLRTLLEREGVERLRTALGDQARELRSWLPELAPADTRELDAAAARFRQFDAIARLLRELARPREAASPVRVIILDDLHAFDEASLKLLRFVLPELSELRLLLIATYRDLELVPGSELAACVDACAGSARRIDLRGLEVEDCARLIDLRGQLHAARELCELSGGNPLLLNALAQRLAQDAGEPLSELAGFALPERITRAVREHLAQLPAQTRGVLAAASGLGREFALPTLARLLGCGEPQLLEWLEPARRRGLIRPAPLGAAFRAFSNALVRHAVYSELAPSERLWLHRAIAELLEAGAQPGRLPLYELAHHYQRAAADGCRDKAIEYSLLAAAQAERMMAFEVAAGLYERTFELTQLEAADGSRRHGWLCQAGSSWYRAGELERASACFHRAAALARQEHDAERFAWAVMMCATTLRGKLLHERALQEQLRQALQLLPEGESRVKALLLSVSMLGARAQRSLPERRQVTRAAVAMARRLEDEQVLQWALNGQHLTLWGAAPAAEMAAIASEMIELGQRTGDSELMLDAMLWRIANCGEGGQTEDVLRYHSEYARESERRGSPWHRYMALGAMTHFAAVQGDFARAAELSEQSRALGLRVGEPLAEGDHEVRALFLRFHRGPWREQSTRVPASVPADYRVLWVLAAAMNGELSAARPTLRLLEQGLIHDELLDAFRKPTLAVLGLAAVMLDQPAAIEQAYRALSPEPDQHLHLLAWEYLGPLSYYLGLMAAALGQAEEAGAHFERSLSETQRALAFRAYTQCEYGRTCLVLGEGERARQLLREAEQSAARFGMAPLHARATAALASSG